MLKDEYDVIVVGASNAGAFAAAAAAEKGAKVLVIDKMHSSVNLFRHWLGGVGSKAQTKAGINIDKAKLIEFLSAFAQDNVNQRLIKTWVNNSGEMLDWLEKEVLKPHNVHLYVEPDAKYETLINKAFPTELHVSADDTSSDFTWGEYLLEKNRKLGVEFVYSTKLEHLLVDEKKKVVGISVKDETTSEVYQVRARQGVILCTGGYGANEALVQKWAPTLFKKCVCTVSSRDDGSGIVAALEIGATKDDEAASIIFDRGAVPVGTNMSTTYIKKWDYKSCVLGSYPLLKVNLRGERFFNESAPYQFAMNSLLHQPGNLEVMIWDENTLNNLDAFHTLGCARLGWPGILGLEQQKENINSLIEDGIVKKAASISELAEKLQLPKEQLQKTIARYNQLCIEKKDVDFGKEASRLIAIEQGPFYGVTIGGMLLATLDGLRVNDKMQVLDRNSMPISNLYAAGNCSGGFFWGSYPDRVPGLTGSHAMTFGRLAGKYATQDADS